MNTRAEAARRAYALSLSQLDRLRNGDVDAYLAVEAELAGLYHDMLDQSEPLEAGVFQDEFEATTRELAGVQQVICAELDALLERTSEALSAQRRRRAVTRAYSRTFPPQHRRGA